MARGQSILGQSNQGSMKSTTTVVNLATCSVAPLSKIIGKLSANFGG